MTKNNIALPDWEGRKHWLWQILDRAWRLAMYWLTALGVGYVCFIGHFIQRPMDEAYAALVLVWAGGLVGNKTFEKIRGVS